MTDEYRPRFTFEITDEQKTRVDSLLSTHGIRKAIFTPILEDVLNLLETHGNIIVGILIDCAAKPREIIPCLSKCEREAKKCQP